MKFKSKMKGVFYEPWDTPVINEEILAFEGILTTRWKNHICFSKYKQNDIYVITIHSTDPFRLFEEGHSSFLNKYFKYDELSPEEYTRLKPDSCRTWKLWGTQFIKEMDEGLCLSDYKSEHDNNIFQCIVATQDQILEFICPNPEWRIFEDSSFEAVVKYYLKEDIPKT